MKRRYILFCVSVLILSALPRGLAENIDPYNDGSKYAYGENVGWFNFKPSQGPGVAVREGKVIGYVWQENIGWINLSPTSYGGVTYDSQWQLSGYAWSENLGWINFNPTVPVTARIMELSLTAKAISAVGPGERISAGYI